jgi:hypothetical protein
VHESARTVEKAISLLERGNNRLDESRGERSPLLDRSGQEGWLRDQVKIAKPPYFRADGVVDPETPFLDPPPRRFAPPLLSRRGDCSPRDSSSLSSWAKPFGVRIQNA